MTDTAKYFRKGEIDMLRSMYAGISGLRGFQTKLDVIGNNIANVNTVGFKKGRITFQDMLSQTSSGAQAPTAERGGMNPIQVGVGSQVGSIDNVHTQGHRQSTDRTLDLQLEGNGMFILEGNGTTYYTRAGNFYLDDNDRIVNANGYYLQSMNGGYITIPEDVKSFKVMSDGTVSYVAADGSNQTAGQIALANFSNPGGLEKAGSNLYLMSENAGYNGISAPETDGTAKIIAGALEMSNVDLSEEFTEMITAQRGFQANTRIITTSDEILQELVNLKR
jgi:flagellar hook protein FlgE